MRPRCVLRHIQLGGDPGRPGGTRSLNALVFSCRTEVDRQMDEWDKCTFNNLGMQAFLGQHALWCSSVKYSNNKCLIRQWNRSQRPHLQRILAHYPLPQQIRHNNSSWFYHQSSFRLGTHKIEAKRSEFGLKLCFSVGTYRFITTEVGAPSETCATHQPR